MSPELQAMSSVALAVPTLAIVWASNYLPQSFPIPIPLVGYSCCAIYFIAILAIVAGTSNRRRALLVAGATAVVFITARVIARYSDGEGVVGPTAFLISQLALIGFMTAWSLGRRNINGLPLGIAAGAFPIVVIGVIADYYNWLEAWLMTSGLVTLGCVIAWIVDIVISRRAGQTPTPATT